LFPLFVIGGIALAAGLVAGALHVPAERTTAKTFVRAWERGDYVTMYGLISADARRLYPIDRFRTAYASAADTSTLTALRAGKVSDPQGGVVELPMTVRTRLFGVIRQKLRLPFSGSGDSARVAWGPELAFPGVDKGEQLRRQTQMPRRAAILANNGKVLASESDRSAEPDVADAAAQIVGSIGAMPPEDRETYRALGYPDDVQVGTSGLERALQTRVAGRPGGTLFAGTRVLARTQPIAAKAVTSTISPKLEVAAVNALGGRGAMTIIRPATGEILALANFAFSNAGPPGSTFKVITTSAALTDHKVKLTDEFPVRTAAILSGVPLHNASSESCGGSFVHSFAESCNSVFAPLGVKVGKDSLVKMAEAYGFNTTLGIPGAVKSEIPQPSEIGDDLDLGSTAIGQGKVVATTLQMAVIAATIANDGERINPTLIAGQRTPRNRVISRGVAELITRLMIAVVNGGTGKQADVPEFQIAGKTGTAEVGTDASGNSLPTDAWFIAFAPARARHPKLAVAVTVPRSGAGGDVAAPIARQVLVDALG
jgi:hypothetical protein